MASTAWAAATAARIGRRAGAAAVVAGRNRPNPFTGRGLDDLARAWQAGYDDSAGSVPSRSS